MCMGIGAGLRSRNAGAHRTRLSQRWRSAGYANRKTTLNRLCTKNDGREYSVCDRCEGINQADLRAEVREAMEASIEPNSEAST